MGSKDNNKKIKDLKEEYEKLKNSISIMQSDITDKNSRIAQLDTINMRLYTHNNHLIQLCTKGKLFVKEEEKEAESEDEDERNEERGIKRETEERNEQRSKQKAKCLWHEKARCSRENSKFRHPRKVCKNYNQENCERGENCTDNHPKKNCTYWIHGNCNRGYNCPLRHS